MTRKFSHFEEETMHNYSRAMEALIDEIGISVYRKDYWESGDADRKFGPIKNSPVPFIPCQYHGIMVAKLPNGKYPGGNLYPDKSWEGARVTGSGQNKRMEFYGGFNVIKDERGRCLIPDTPNNRNRLNKMGNTIKDVFETQTFVDERGTTRSRRVVRKVVSKPLYTILGEDVAGANIEELIRVAAEKIVRDRDEKAALPGPTVIEVVPGKVSLEGVVDLRPDAAPDHGQPVAEAAGGDETAPPPAQPPQPTTSRRTPASLKPGAVAAAAAAAGDDY
jgi:hypothetical protein